MDWMDTAQARLCRKNQVLFRPGDELLLPLARELEGAGHRAAALWADKAQSAYCYLLSSLSGALD